jgi:predicted DNA binding CopG/RHH family protein
MTQKAKKVPDFKSEDAERRFWATHDSSDYVDWGSAQPVRLPNLKPSTETISLRLPRHLLDSIRLAANSRDVPYQSLIKLWLQEKLESQRR